MTLADSSTNIRAFDVLVEEASSVARRPRRLWWIAALPGAVTVAAAIAGPWIAPYNAGKTVARPFEAASSIHRLGTDQLGRDVWSQLLHGGRAIVVVPVVATIITGTVAGLLGVVCGYFRGRVDTVISRAVDVMIALPAILVLLVLVNGWGSSSTILVVAVVLTIGPYSMRYARATTLQIVTSGYVEHAVAQGESSMGVILRELVPNVVGPVLADSALRLVGSIYLIASASFLGFGPQPPATDWARQVQENLQGIGLNAWAVVAPAVAVALFAVSVMVTADDVVRRWGA